MLTGWELGVAETAIVAAIFVFGGLVKGATGFGLPLVTISLTPLVAPLDLALALNTLVVPITNIGQFAAAGGWARSAEICWPLIAGLVVTVFATAWLVAEIDPLVLSAALGSFLIAFALLSVASPTFRLPRRAEKPAAFATGLAGGAVAAVTTAPGPVFAMYFVGLGLERRQMISAMGLAMLSVGALVSGAFAAVGLLDGPRAVASALAAGPAFAGMWLGDRLARRVSVEGFRRMILVMLLGLGLHHILKALV